MKKTILNTIAESMSGGGWDAERIPKVIEFVTDRSKQYAEKLGVPVEDVLKAWEDARDYSAVNYYQNANFPEITGEVLLMDSNEHMKDFCAGKGFTCGACGKNTKSPYECAGCGWKTYGLFGPGKGATFVVLRPAMRGEWIFKPVVMLDQAKQA